MAEKLKILHIEDLPEDVELVARALKKLSFKYESKVVSTRDDYVKALEDYKPDIILSDHSLPSFNSVEALQIARQLGCKMPFILVTATVSDEFAVSVIKQGANDYILKGRLERLPSAVEVAVETYKLELEREAGERRFKALIEYSEDMLTLISETKNVTYISPAVERLLGYRNSDALCYMDLIHASDREAMALQLQEVFQNPGKPVQSATRYMKKNGSYLWVEGTLTNMLAVPSVNSIVANFRDVTTGRETEERFRHIVETAQEGVWITDENRKTTFVNDKLCEILEYSHDEMIGKTSTDFMAEADVQYGLEAAKRREQGIKETMELRFLTKTRRYMWANVSASPIVDEHGTYRGALAMVTDITMRKIAEDALVRSEELMRTILENSLDAISLYDGNGKVIYESPAVAKMLGYKPSEIMGRNRTDLFHPDEQESARIFFKMVLDNPGVPMSTQRRMRHKDGYYIWTEGTATNLLGDNKVNGIITNFRDISERRTAEKALKESEYKFRSLIQHSSDAITVINENEDIIFASDSLFRITGFTVEDLVGEHSRQYVHPEDIPYIRRTFKDLISNPGTPKSFSYRRLRKDGSYFWCEGTAVNLINEPAVGGIVINFRDITERKEAERQQLINLAEIKAAVETLSRSEANLNTIFNNGDTIYILVDTSLNVVSFNQLARKYAEEELQAPLVEGAYLFDSVAVDRQPVIFETISGLLRGGEESIETEYALSDKSDKSYYVRYFPVANDKKEIFGIILAINDITERKLEELKTLKLLELLQKKNKDLGQFAYIVSHNLRAPIAKILGLVALVESTAADAAPDVSLIELIANEATNLDTVVKDLNTIITARDHDTEPREYVSFEEQLKLILQVLNEDLLACEGEVNFHFPEPGIYTIKSYLYSIMYNLVSNAIKYRSPAQQLSVYIQTKRENDFICLSVADNGMGMDMNKYQRKIFGLYKRFHGDSIPGKGLGLYLVKTQTETLGGTVDVRSEVNEGTTFKISLPI